MLKSDWFSWRKRWWISQSSEAWLSWGSCRCHGRPVTPVTSSPDCQRLCKCQGFFSRSSPAHTALPIPVTWRCTHAKHSKLLALRTGLSHFAHHFDSRLISHCLKKLWVKRLFDFVLRKHLKKLLRIIKMRLNKE